MKVKEWSFNPFFLVSLIFGTVLCVYGELSWWVFALIFVSHIETNFTFKRKVQ